MSVKEKSFFGGTRGKVRGLPWCPLDHMEVYPIVVWIFKSRPIVN